MFKSYFKKYLFLLIVISYMSNSFGVEIPIDFQAEYDPLHTISNQTEKLILKISGVQPLSVYNVHINNVKGLTGRDVGSTSCMISYSKTQQGYDFQIINDTREVEEMTVEFSISELINRNKSIRIETSEEPIADEIVQRLEEQELKEFLEEN